MKVIILVNVKERLRPIIEALVMMLDNKEFEPFLDKKQMVDSCLDQIVAALRETKVITVKEE